MVEISQMKLALKATRRFELIDQSDSEGRAQIDFLYVHTILSFILFLELARMEETQHCYIILFLCDKGILFSVIGL